MHRIVLVLLAALWLGACASTGDDRTAGWSASQLYDEAKSALDSGDYQQAIDYFETLEARYPFGRYAQQAQLEIAYAYFKFGEYDSAVGALDRFMKLNPQHPYLDYAYYLRGLSNFDRGASILDKVARRDPSETDTATIRTAFNDFSTLITRFPQSRYAADARERMLYLRNVLAAHEMKVADYYMRRGAFVAVINRCTYVIEHYEGAESVPQALEMMAQAYDRLGMTDLAADTRRVLATNVQHFVGAGAQGTPAREN